MVPTELTFELGPEPELGRGSSGIDWEDESAASEGWSLSDREELEVDV